MMNDPEVFLSLVESRLNFRTPVILENPPLHFRHAGVLIPLFIEHGIPKVLFTKRSDMVETHKGQISFPGGSVEDQDLSVQETALRETREEVGVLETDVKVFGRIDDLYTVASDFLIHPFVGLIPSPYDFRICEVEVKRLIMVPWEILIQQNRENRTYVAESRGKTFETPAYEYEGDVIWGATAKMVKNLINIIADGDFNKDVS